MVEQLRFKLFGVPLSKKKKSWRLPVRRWRKSIVHVKYFSRTATKPMYVVLPVKLSMRLNGLLRDLRHRGQLVLSRLTCCE